MIESSLMLHVEQITDGDVGCAAGECNLDAVLMIGNGADPELEPYCAQHGVEWLGFTSHTIRSLWGRQFADTTPEPRERV